jgi:predicted DNA-binding transcriptional regulator AlpA
MEGEKSESPDFVLTRKETAGRLRISLRTLSRMERDKKMPPRIRLSDRIYGYRQSAIENYLFARTA